MKSTDVVSESLDQPSTPAKWKALLGNELISYKSAAIPVWDYGFTMGVTLTERLRTFGGRLPLIDLHLNRLFQGVDAIGLGGMVSRTDVADGIRQIASLNSRMVAQDSDLAIGVCITPGAMPSAFPETSASKAAQAGRVSAVGRPTILIYASELDFVGLDRGFREGASLAIVDIREIPGQSIPKFIKHRNRMHYYLAEREASQQHRGAKALLLDHEGYVAEATTGSIVMIQGQQLIAPPNDKVLPSVSFEFATTFFGGLGLTLERRDITPDEILRADEVVWFSTSTLIQPVTRINGQSIGNGRSGAVFKRLLAAFCEHLKLDIASQASRLATD